MQRSQNMTFAAVSTLISMIYPNEPEWPVNSSTMQYGFFISFYDNYGVIGDFAYFGTCLKSCVQKSFLEVYYDKICFNGFLYLTPYCHGRYSVEKPAGFMMSIVLNESDSSTMRTYFSFNYSIQPFTTSTLHFCLTEADSSNVSVGTRVNGTFKERAKEYMKVSKGLTHYQVLNHLHVSTAQYFCNNMAVYDYSDEFVYVGVVCALLLVAVGIGVVLFHKRESS